MKPKFNVLLHKQGSLLSLEDDSDLSLRQGQKLIYSIQQEVLNKTEVADFFDCDPKLDDLEDDDLEVCLVKKFDERALCRSKHLEFLVAKHGLGDQLTFQRDCERFRDEAKNEEYVEIIRDIIDGFTADRAHGNHSARCGIKPPCVARIFRLRLVERFREQRPEKSTFLVRTKITQISTQITVFFISFDFQFENLVKVHSYLPPKSFGGFLADIGGHLGLFLGFSAYTVVEILQGWIAERKKFREEEEEEEEKRKNKGQSDKKEVKDDDEKATYIEESC